MVKNKVGKVLISLMSLVLIVSSLTGCAKKNEEVVKPEESKVGLFNEIKTYEDAETYESGVISVDGVVLKNAEFTNDLVISDSVGEGTIYLDNVKIKGKLIVEGGGMNSIHVDNSDINKIVSNRTGGRVRIAVSENTKVQETEVLQDTKLEVSGNIANIKLSETAKGSEVLVNATAKVATLETKAEISLTVDSAIDKLSLQAPSNVVLNAPIENLSITKEAENTAISIAKDVVITNLATEGKVDVQGEGTITNATTTDKNNITGNVKPDSTVISETPISDQENPSIIVPTATPVATAKPKPTVQPTVAPTATPEPTVAPTPVPTPAPKPTYTVSFELDGYSVESQKIKQGEKVSKPVVSLKQEEHANSYVLWLDNSGSIYDFNTSVSSAKTLVGKIVVDVTSDNIGDIVANDSVKAINITKDITLDTGLSVEKSLDVFGNNYTLEVKSGNVFTIKQEANFELYNLNVVAKHNESRGIEISKDAKTTILISKSNLLVGARGVSYMGVSGENLSGEKIITKLTIKDSTIKNASVNNYETETKIDSNARGISLFDIEGEVNIENSEILGFGYAINVSGTKNTDNVNILDDLVVNLTNSKVNSWAAFNIWGSYSTYNISESVLKGINTSTGGSNSFATIVFNDDIYNQFGDIHAESNIMNIHNSTVTNYQSDTSMNAGVNEQLIRVDCGIDQLVFSGNVNLIDTTGNQKSAIYLEAMNSYDEAESFITKNIIIKENANVISKSNDSSMPLTVNPFDSITVNTSEDLSDALTQDYKNIIISGTLGSTSAYTIYRVEKPVKITGTEGNKIYGSFIIDADNVTMDGLEIRNQGWVTGNDTDARRNAITVVSNKVTLTNNKLFANTNISGEEAISNGIVIQAGTDVDTNLFVKGNIIQGYTYENPNWSSKGIIITQGSSFPYNTTNKQGGTSTVALTVDAVAIAKANKYENCYNDFIKENYETGTGSNVYEYVYVSNASGITGGLFYAHPTSAIVELAPGTYNVSKEITHENGSVNYFTIKPNSKLIVPSSAIVNIAGDTELVIDVNGTLEGTVNGTINNKNVDPIISDASVKYVAESEDIIVEFKLDKGFVLNNYDGMTNIDEITAAYTSYLMGYADANESAKKIGNDLILTYYYKDDDGKKIELETAGGNPLVKFKMWNGYLNYFDGKSTVRFADGADTYLGQTIPSDKTWTTSTNPETLTVNKGWLMAAEGHNLYVDIIVLYEGKTIKETVEVYIPRTDSGWDATTADTSWYTTAADGATTLELSSAAQLAGLAQLVNGGNTFKGKTITLLKDIDLNNKNWTPIGSINNQPNGETSNAKPFEGTFDGNNKVISNLSCLQETATTGTGLFGLMVTPGRIKNVTVKNADLLGKANVGTIIGSYFTGSLDNCNVLGNIKIQGNYKVGGLAGEGYGKVANSKVEVDSSSYVKAEYKETNFEGDNVGGLIGFTGELNSSTFIVTNCSSNVNVEGTRKVGGLVGFLNRGVGVQNSTATGNVNSNASADYTSSNKISVGGLVGEVQGTADIYSVLENCSATGTVTGKSSDKTGAIVGYLRTNETIVHLINCSWTAGQTEVGNGTKTEGTNVYTIVAPKEIEVINEIVDDNQASIVDGEKDSTLDDTSSEGTTPINPIEPGLPVDPSEPVVPEVTDPKSSEEESNPKEEPELGPEITE